MASKTAEWYKMHGMSEIIGADENGMREIIKVAREDKDIARSVQNVRRDCPAERLVKVKQIVQTDYGRKALTRYLLARAVDSLRPMRDKIVDDCIEKDRDCGVALSIWDNAVMPITAMMIATKLALAIIVATEQCILEQSRKGVELMERAWND